MGREVKMKLSLFMYAVLLHPKKKKDDDYEGETKILVEPDIILAKDERQAGIKVARKIPEDQLDNLDRIDILVKPF